MAVPGAGQVRYADSGGVRIAFGDLGGAGGDPLLRPAAARRTAAAISGARLVLLPGAGHYLPAGVFGQIAGEVRALARRAAASPPQAGAA